jgi:hypothetical protein
VAQEGSLRLYRCILDGIYFREKKKAELHLVIEHNFKEADDSLIREVVFGPEIEPQTPRIKEGKPTA